MRRCVLKTVGDTRQRISLINRQLAIFSPLRDTDVGTLTLYVLSIQMLSDNVMFLSFSSRPRRSFPMENLLTLFSFFFKHLHLWRIYLGAKPAVDCFPFRSVTPLQIRLEQKKWIQHCFFSMAKFVFPWTSVHGHLSRLWLVGLREVSDVNIFSDGGSLQRAFCFWYTLVCAFSLSLSLSEDQEKRLFSRIIIIMGVGGHKHHFNESHIEKEMKSIGEAVSEERSRLFPLGCIARCWWYS